MQELLFKNLPIIWINTGPTSLIITIGIFFIICIAFFFSHKNKKSDPEKNIAISWIPVKENHPDYITKTLITLKEYLSKLIPTRHIVAHTADEIAIYLNNPPLKEIIHELEHREYSGQGLTLTERTIYNARILRALDEQTGETRI